MPSLIDRVLELDENATEGPWNDTDLIIEYRTAAPKLARALFVALTYIKETSRYPMQRQITLEQINRLIKA